MARTPPESTRNEPLFPYTALFRAGRDQHRSRFRWRKHEIGSAEILVVEGDFLQQRPAGDNPVPAIAWRKEEWRRLSMKRLHAFERILDKSGIVDEVVIINDIRRNTISDCRFMLHHYIHIVQ